MSEIDTVSAISKDDALKLAKLSLEDPVFFCKTFLPHWFPQDIPWFHRAMLAILCRRTGFLKKYGDLDLIYEFFVWRQHLDDPNSPKVHLFEWDHSGGLILNLTAYTLLMLPRGFAKTTICNASILWDCAFNIFGFTCYIGETATHSEAQLANVKRELESNARFIAVFGALRPDQRSGYKWAEDEIQLTNGAIVVARGRGGQVRGLLRNGRRPRRVVIEDVEDKESVKTPEQRDKTLSWFFSDVVPVPAPEDPLSHIICSGTLLHNEALLAKLRVDPEWNTVILGATFVYNGVLRELWAWKMTFGLLDRKKAAFARQGKVHLYYLEYHNQIRSPENAKFKPEQIIVPTDFNPADFPFRAIACDPAISDDKDADFFALGCVGMSEKGIIAVLDVWGEVGVHPRRQVDEFFNMRKIWGFPRRNGIEAIAYQKALVHLVREEMFRKKDYFEIEELKHGKTGKHERVEGILVPRYSARYMVHARHFMSYESCLLDWPNGRKDEPDVVAMAVGLLDPYAAQAADPDKDLGEDEYEDVSDYQAFHSAP